MNTNPIQQAAQLALDLNDEICSVHRLALRRGYRHLLLVLDSVDPAARELLDSYAPLSIQLARGGQEEVEIIALTFSDGLRLLRTPNHNAGERHIFHTVADQIEADKSELTHGVCVTGGGFHRFRVGMPGFLDRDPPLTIELH